MTSLLASNAVRLVILTVVVGLAIVTGIVELLRRRRLREKYAALWLATALLVLVLAIFPRGPDVLAQMVGVKNGISLVLFASVVFLLVVCLHLTWEVSRLDEKTRTLSEEIALLHLDQQTGTQHLPALGEPVLPPPGSPADHEQGREQ
jgi:hypothetical protein